MSDLPYNSMLPHQVTIHFVYFAELWLNSLPAAAGVSEKYSPHEIVLGRELNFDKHCEATFGSYVEARNDVNPDTRGKTVPPPQLPLTAL